MACFHITRVLKGNDPEIQATGLKKEKKGPQTKKTTLFGPFCSTFIECLELPLRRRRLLFVFILCGLSLSTKVGCAEHQVSQLMATSLYFCPAVYALTVRNG